MFGNPKIASTIQIVFLNVPGDLIVDHALPRIITFPNAPSYLSRGNIRIYGISNKNRARPRI
jgi:hypothetical protein